MELGSLSSIGRYEVVERLGSGGFATVYLVRDPVLDSEVAAKVLAENWAGAPEIRDRFIREAQLLRRIDSNRVVTVHDIGELPSGQPYFVMSLAGRGTLEQRLNQQTVAPSRADVNALAHQIADCVHAVHTHDLIHRDIKPSNLLVTGNRSAPASTSTPTGGLVGTEERLVLGDFGLAKDIALQATGMTIAAGTGGYAAPEQMSPTGAPDRQTDLYAATAVMYRAVTNTTPPPFDLGQGVVPFPDEEWWMVGHLGQFFREGMTFNQADRHGSIDDWLAGFVGAYGGGQLLGLSGLSALDPDSPAGAQSAPRGVIQVETPSADAQASMPTASLASSPADPTTPPPVYTPPSAPPSVSMGPGHVMSQPVAPPVNVEHHPTQHLLDPGFHPDSEHPRAGWGPTVGSVEPVRRGSRWPVVLLGLLVFAMVAVGGVLLATRGQAPTVVGPTEVVAGELQTFSATFTGADSFRWTDWNDQVSEGDTFEFRGIVPGTISFDVEAITGDQVSRSTSHHVLITPAPDSPTIVGPPEIRVGVEELFTFEVADGSDPEWIDANGSNRGEQYRLTGTAPGPFEVKLIVTRSDGVTRVGTRRVIQIVE